jgi:hypothetical protein
MEAAMKMTRALFILTLLLAACGPAPAGEAIPGCRALLAGIANLRGGDEIPVYFEEENPVKQGGEFDVMQYFTVLDHLSMQPGYILDYVYHFDGMGGYPVLYIRPDGQPPYATEADLPAAGGITNYMDYIQADGTPEGWFQFIVLSMTARRFYLFWHANYNDQSIVCDKAAVMMTVNAMNSMSGQPMPLKARIQARFLQNVEPRIQTGDETVVVQVTTFTQWGGFYRRTYTLQRVFPHTILDSQEENLIPYDCGIVF